MATFEELFPDAVQAPIDPIKTNLDSRLVGIRSRVRQAIPTGVGAEGANSGNGLFLQAFGDILNTPPSDAQPSAPQPEWKDYGRAAMAGVGDIGQMAAGAGEYVANKFTDDGSTVGEQFAGDVAGMFKSGRQASAAFAQDWSQSMTPEAQERISREILTLDPNKTLWQGGPRELLSAVGLKLSRSAPSTVATLLPGALMLRAGMGAGALTYLGASEGGLSMGSIAANIATEIEQASEEELMQSQRYQELRQSMGEPEARQALIGEAQGYAPVIGGLVVGAISAATGRYLEPVLVDKPAGVLARFARGYASEGMQEAGQSGAEQIAQNYAAQLYDNDRKLGEGVPEQVVQGGVVGGLAGGLMTAGLGQGPQQFSTNETSELPLQPLSPSDTPAAPQSFEEVFGKQTPPAGGWQGGEIEFGSLPDIDSTGQRLIDVGPVDRDLQAALNARRENKITDMFEQSTQTPQEEQASYLAKPFPYEQTGMDLPQAEMGMVPATGQNEQLPLGLTQRVRGGPPEVITPTPAQPIVDDMSAPPEFSMERQPANVMPVGRRPTRADFIRAQVEADRARRSAGTVRDENQIDMFASPESPAPTQLIQELAARLADDAEATQDPRLQALQQRVTPTMTQADVLTVFKEYAAITGTDMNPNGRARMNDVPSAEPISDIKAQLDDLRDPDSSRLGVYLSSANIEQLRRDGTFEQVRGSGVPLADFDGKGGTLIAKNRQAADKLVAMRNDPNADLQEVLGLATGAGAGKPPGASIAVQQRNEQGNVVRESLVATPEEADALAAQFDTPGHEGVILSADMAIRRRNQKIKQESRGAAAKRDTKQVKRFAEDTIDKELGDTPLAYSAKKKIGKAPLSENEAARKLVGYAARLRKREMTKNVGDISRPETLKFGNEKIGEEYKTLFGQYRDAELAERLATTTENRIKARASRESLTRQISTFRRLNKATTASEDVARVARKISSEEVSKIEREARESAKAKTRSEDTGASREEFESVSEAQLKDMSDTELNLFFTEAANIASGSRVQRSATGETGGTAEKYVTTLFTPHGKTIDEILKAYPTRSEKLKLIARVKRMLDQRKYGGKSKTTPITSKAGTRKGADGKVSVRKSVFQPTKAFDLNPPREMSVEEASKHNERVRSTYHALEQSVAGVRKSIDTIMRPIFLNMARTREATNGNPPQNARDAVYGRVYLRTLYRYGQLLNRLHGRSVSALKEVDRYNKVVEQLLAAPKEKFLSTLAKLTEAEIGEQVRTTAKTDPTNLGFLSNRKRRIAATLESISKLKEQVAWSKRLHDKWHTNMYFNSFVAPLMQKLIGYTTRDAAPWNYAIERRGLGAVPTLKEMQDLAFALKRFRGGANTRIDLFDPLKRFFTEFGFKFDGQDLVIPMKDGKLDYNNETDLLRKMRDRFAYNHPLTAEERAAESDVRRKRREAEEFERAESVRKAALTDEQRAAEADQDPRLKLEIADATAARPQMRQAASKLGSVLESESLVGLNDALKSVASSLPADHAYQPLIQRLLNLSMDDALVTWDRSGQIVGDNSPGHFDDNLTDSSGKVRRVIRLNRNYFENWRSLGYDPSGHIIHTFLHEAVHSATVGALQSNRGLQASIRAIMQQAERQLDAEGKETKHYAFKNEKEFVAEAFTNPAFQDVLRSIDVAKGTSFWQWIINTVRRLLGIPDTAQANNALEVVMMTSDSLFTGELRTKTRGTDMLGDLKDEPGVMSKIGNVYDKAMQSSRVTQEVRRKATNLIERNREGGSRFVLSALTMEQIRDFYAKSFGGSGGPLSEYMKAFFKRNADNTANMEEADKLSRMWTALTEKHGVESATEFSRIATESTLYGIHPDEPLTSKLNAHLKSIPQKQRHTDLHRRYKAMNPEWRQMFSSMQDFYSQSLRREVNLMVLNALRATVGEKGFNYSEKDVETKKLGTIQGMEKEFGDRVTPDERKVIQRMASLPDMHIGPYFPLMRFGDYVVTAKKVKETKHFAKLEDARKWAEEQRQDDPTLSVSTPVEDDSGYSVQVREEEVRMAESPSEAEQNRAEMLSEYGAENVSQVQLKAQLYQNQSTIESNRGLKTILDKLSGNPAAQAAIKDFYLRSLADGAFRKREIKRANRRGVDYDTQHRTFASYAKSAAYYTSQLRFGWQMADALIGMQKYVEETARGEHQADLSPVRMGEVVREIDTRNKLGTQHVEVSKLVRGGTALSQFMMLTSPSYWIINSTQPYMVTLPWLAARTSIGEATAALTAAQKLIAHPILSQMGESVGGLKALWSKAGSEKAFTVLEQVEEYIKKRGGDRANEYITMLNNLKRESIIDLSFVAELRDIAEGQNSSTTQRVLDASRIMSHLTEVNNRILTALAAYDLYRNKGLSTQEAEGFAKQAVSLTQFNYSSGNSPRLFQARGPLGQAGPLVFQFMKYPQHMYALLIDNFRRAVYSGGMDRKIAIKTLAGIFATHLAAGGLMGAMIQPIKWAMGLALAAFGDDDEPYTVANALSGETFDRLVRKATTDLFGTEAGEILSGGLPRAVGVDVSNRMSLGTLYFIDLKTDTAESTIGSLASAFGGPLVNMGMGWWRGAQYYEQGQLDKAMEAFLPKGAKDIIRTIRYSNEGLTDSTGKEILGANKLTPTQLFMQSMGFQPSIVAEKYAQRAAIKDAQSYDTGRKNELMTRFKNAKTAEERQSVLADVVEFNKKNPGAGITRSQLIKSQRGFYEAGQRSGALGVNLRGKNTQYLEEGEAYNVE